jgi:hypothetical protein
MKLGCALWLVLALGGVAQPAWAQEQKTAGPTVRAEIGKPIQAALDALKKKQGKDALARIAEADAMKDKTQYEIYVIERIRAQASILAGDPAAAGRAFEKAAFSPAAPAGEKMQVLGAAVSQYYAAKEYARAAENADRYLRDGGTDKAVRTLLTQSLYLGGDFARAAREIAVDVRNQEQAGATPPEEQLQLLADAALKQRDDAAYAAALEKLIAYYPKRDYWLAAIHLLQTRSRLPGRLTLDLARLKLATGSMRTANEYIEAAQLSLQEGLPGEASKILERGYAANLLGSGPEADRHGRLRAMAAKDLAEDRKTRAQDDAQAGTAADGNALFNAGFNHVLNGDYDKGLEMMERGVRTARLKNAEDRRLHLGYAYYLAGKNSKAVEAFKAVPGSVGTAALARLWVVHLERKTGVAAAAPRAAR